jgi:hypothetical protein
LALPGRCAPESATKHNRCMPPAERYPSRPALTFSITRLFQGCIDAVSYTNPLANGRYVR